MVQEAHPKVWEGSAGPCGCPRGVGRPTQRFGRFGRTTQRFEWGKEAHLKDQETLGG